MVSILFLHTGVTPVPLFHAVQYSSTLNISIYSELIIFLNSTVHYNSVLLEYITQ